MVYLTLFFSALVSATLVPLGSEALLLYDLHLGYDVYLLLVSATLGNTLGAVINYWMGLGGEEMLERRRLIRQGALQKPKNYFDRYGAVMLLFSWTPFVGDLFTFAAGVLKYPFWRFVVIVAIAKAARYTVLLYGWDLLSVGDF